jgi:ubiquinone/menaquinone biosynthesis C-methylase UbiE/DNA-binding transcriptional ArsR family regulator
VTAGWEILKLLADPTRLRLLALLSEEELSVVELQEILGMGQSRISTHLSLLRQASLLQDRRDGKRTYYTLREGIPDLISGLLRQSLIACASMPEIEEDKSGLNRILLKRRQVAEAYFNRVAGRFDNQYCPGRSWESLGQFLLLLTPALSIADLGAGEGLISQMLARRAEKVYCIDNSPRMVEFGTDLAAKNQLPNLVYKLGDIEAVPLEDQCVDLALLSQALHHAEHPQKAVQEAYRILRPKGRVAILDLKEHTFESARESFADRWLGFTENTLYTFLKKAGFRQIEINSVAREEEPPHFETLLATGIR